MENEYEIIGPNRLFEINIGDYFKHNHNKNLDDYFFERNKDNSIKRVAVKVFEMLPVSNPEKEIEIEKMEEKARYKIDNFRTKLHAKEIIDLRKKIINTGSYREIFLHGIPLITNEEKMLIEAEKDFRNTYRDEINAIKYKSKNGPIDCTFLEGHNIIRIKDDPTLMAYVLASKKMEDKEGREIMKMISEIVPETHHFKGKEYSTGKGLFGPN